MHIYQWFVKCIKLCPQIKSVWDGELQNIVQMSFGMSTTLNCLELEGKIRTTRLAQTSKLRPEIVELK